MPKNPVNPEILMLRQLKKMTLKDHIYKDLIRIEYMIEKLSTQVDTGDIRAIETTCRLLDRKAKMLNLDQTSLPEENIREKLIELNYEKKKANL